MFVEGYIGQGNLNSSVLKSFTITVCVLFDNMLSVILRCCVCVCVCVCALSMVAPVEFIARSGKLGLGAAPKPKPPPDRKRPRKPGDTTDKARTHSYLDTKVAL